MNTAESALYSHLTETESLEYIIREGFSLEEVRDVIPTELGRKIVEWAIDYYFQSGRTVAPSKEAIEATWGEQFEGADIEIIDDVEMDSVQWAIDQLRTDYVDYQAGEFAKALSTAVRQADGPDRAGVLQDYSGILHILAQSVTSRRTEMDGAEGILDAIERYEERALNDHAYSGLTFGLPEVDEHTLGIHDGEICIYAGTSGGGKSFFSMHVMLNEFRRGRKVILFSIENDLEMSFDRMACMYCRVDYEKWQKAECDEGSMVRVKEFLKELEESPNKPVIVHPEEGQATGVAMIRKAMIMECDSIIIDQLSHIEQVPGSTLRQRNEIVAEIVKDLAKLINQPGTKLPLLLLHQINRKGREEARKQGRYLMEHLGEATQVENTASLVLAGYQSPDHEIAEMMELQMLKKRRIKQKEWNLVWRPAVGDIRVKGEIDRE